jgi:hypothetical protein
MEAWGQPHITAAVLVKAAKLAASKEHMATCAWVAKELHV